MKYIKILLLVAVTSVGAISPAVGDKYRPVPTKVPDQPADSSDSPSQEPGRPGGDVTSPVTSSTTPIAAQEMLQKAILNDSDEGIKQAIQVGADINHGKDGKAPLLWAVLLDKYNAVEALSEAGASVNILYEGKNLVDLILERCSISRKDCLKLALSLVKKGAPLSSGDGKDGRDGNMVGKLFGAVRYSDMGGSKSCLPSDDFNKKSSDFLALMQELINRGYDVNRMWVVAKGGLMPQLPCLDEAFIKFLLKNGANPNQILEINGDSWTPLLQAIQWNNKPAVEALLAAGANINQQGVAHIDDDRFGHIYSVNLPLTFAIRRMNDRGGIQYGSEIVEVLIKNGATVNQTFKDLEDKGERTPLYEAVTQNNLLAIKMLLDAGADINQKINPGPGRGEPFTVLGYAVKTPYRDVIDLLMSRGASL